MNDEKDMAIHGLAVTLRWYRAVLKTIVTHKKILSRSNDASWPDSTGNQELSGGRKNKEKEGYAKYRRMRALRI